MSLGGCIRGSSRLIEAAKDYKYLLNRGYPATSSLNLVVARYQMSRRERSLLLRCVHRDEYSEKILRSIVTKNNLSGSNLLIDLLNVSTTLIAFLEGECLYKCDDGLIRDLGGSRYWKGKKERALEAINMIKEHLATAKPAKIYLVLDRLAPMSSYILKQAMEIFRSSNFDVEGILSERADREIIELSKNLRDITCIVATSDSLILEKADHIYDLAGEIISSANPEKIDKSIYLELYLSQPHVIK
ncbi:MAG: DUF434 domain-containing protein [Desulfurococcales archaeon]|jgi:hypothetical protein|nr:DUF434 domain-containing protein [Desulfurococcales archaeon]